VLNRALFVKNELCRHFKDNGSTAQILGPLRAPLAKIKNKYRWRIVIKCEESDKLIDVLTKVSDGYYSKSAKNSVALSVDINPVNML